MLYFEAKTYLPMSWMMVLNIQRVSNTSWRENHKNLHDSHTIGDSCNRPLGLK